MASGVKTQGLKLQLGTTASPQTFTNIANVAGVQGLGSGNTTEIDVTNFDSTGREFLKGFSDGGTMTVNLNPDPDLSGYKDLEDLFAAGTTRQWRVLLANTGSSYWEFNAYISQFQKDFAIDDAARATVSLRISGRVYFVQ